jgi:hypothetical protein
MVSLTNEKKVLQHWQVHEPSLLFGTIDKEFQALHTFKQGTPFLDMKTMQAGTYDAISAHPAHLADSHSGSWLS